MNGGEGEGYVSVGVVPSTCRKDISDVGFQPCAALTLSMVWIAPFRMMASPARILAPLRYR